MWEINYLLNHFFQSFHDEGDRFLNDFFERDGLPSDGNSILEEDNFDDSTQMKKCLVCNITLFLTTPLHLFIK